MTQPEEISFSIHLQTTVVIIFLVWWFRCFIEASSQGLFPPFSYSWTGPNGFSANTPLIDNLIAGEYNLVIEDNNGCQVLEAILLTEPGKFS